MFSRSGIRVFPNCDLNKSIWDQEPGGEKIDPKEYLRRNSRVSFAIDDITNNINEKADKNLRWRALRNKDDIKNMSEEEKKKEMDKRVGRFSFLDKIGIGRETANRATDRLWEGMGGNFAGRWLRKKLNLSIGQDEDLYKSLETISYLIENIEK